MTLLQLAYNKYPPFYKKNVPFIDTHANNMAAHRSTAPWQQVFFCAARKKVRGKKRNDLSCHSPIREWNKKRPPKRTARRIHVPEITEVAAAAA